jgi:hypothetical protein
MTHAQAQGFLDAVRSLADTFAELAAPAMVIGGVAVIARGVPRSTVDIDATVLIESVDLDRLAAVCAANRIVPRVPDALGFARAHQVYLATHQPSGVPIDITLASLPFEREALTRSTLAEYGDVRIQIAEPEDLLIYKLVASRPRDIDDAEQLLLLYGRTMDLARARRVLQQFADALEDDARLAMLDQLLLRTRLTP